MGSGAASRLRSAIRAGTKSAWAPSVVLMRFNCAQVSPGLRFSERLDHPLNDPALRRGALLRARGTLRLRLSNQPTVFARVAYDWADSRTVAAVIEAGRETTMHQVRQALQRECSKVPAAAFEELDFPEWDDDGVLLSSLAVASFGKGGSSSGGGGSAAESKIPAGSSGGAGTVEDPIRLTLRDRRYDVDEDGKYELEVATPTGPAKPLRVHSAMTLGQVRRMIADNEGARIGLPFRDHQAALRPGMWVMDRDEIRLFTTKRLLGEQSTLAENGIFRGEIMHTMRVYVDVICAARCARSSVHCALSCAQAARDVTACGKRSKVGFKFEQFSSPRRVARHNSTHQVA